MEDDEISSSSSSFHDGASSKESEKGISDKESSDKEVSDKDISDRDASDKEISDKEDERSPSPPPVRIGAVMPSTNFDFAKYKLYHVRLPNFLTVQSREYVPEFYDDEIAEDDLRDNEGSTKLKLKVENTVRWRTITNDEGQQEKQSNARVVEWSDGTVSLYLGSEMFDVTEKTIGECSHLYVRQGHREGLQGLAVFDKKLSIRPSSTESMTHRKLTISLADRSQKTHKIRMLNNPGVDPEQRLSELSKQEDDKFKASMRRETKQRRIQERSQLRGPNASYLEPDFDDDDEEAGVSLSAIKRNALNRNLYEDSDEQSEEDAEEYSDDSDPEFGKIKRKSERKKKQVVDESDDE